VGLDLPDAYGAGDVQGWLALMVLMAGCQAADVRGRVRMTARDVDSGELAGGRAGRHHDRDADEIWHFPAHPVIKARGWKH
jgi:hypothetical protein